MCFRAAPPPRSKGGVDIHPRLTGLWTLKWDSEAAAALPLGMLGLSKLPPPPAAFLKEGPSPYFLTTKIKRILDSLVKGEIENFGSHFQDGPYGASSIGDEKTRWEEFKAFRSQFACKKCGRRKFHHPFPLKKPSAHMTDGRRSSSLQLPRVEDAKPSEQSRVFCAVNPNQPLLDALLSQLITDAARRIEEKEMIRQRPRLTTKL